MGCSLGLLIESLKIQAQGKPYLLLLQKNIERAKDYVALGYFSLRRNLAGEIWERWFVHGLTNEGIYKHLRFGQRNSGFFVVISHGHRWDIRIIS
jgi:hypothetical protein